MSVQPNIYPLRIPKEIMEKGKVVARENGRSLNKEIEIILKQHISSYEQEHGEITIASTDDI